MKKSFLPLLTVLILISCKKDEDPPSNFDYLMFGHFYGECLGEECIEIYRITEDHLFEANQDTYPGENSFSGTLVGLPDSLFQQINMLNLTVPQELMNISETVIGIPDAYDQGGFYIEVFSGGDIRHWRIDTNYNAVPEEIHNFLNDVQEAIDIIP